MKLHVAIVTTDEWGDLTRRYKPKPVALALTAAKPFECITKVAEMPVLASTALLIVASHSIEYPHVLSLLERANYIYLHYGEHNSPTRKLAFGLQKYRALVAPALKDRFVAFSIRTRDDAYRIPPLATLLTELKDAEKEVRQSVRFDEGLAEELASHFQRLGDRERTASLMDVTIMLQSLWTDEVAEGQRRDWCQALREELTNGWISSHAAFHMTAGELLKTLASYDARRDGSARFPESAAAFLESLKKFALDLEKH